MTEMKRVEFSTVKTTEKEPKVKRKLKTIRLRLSLGESNATSCPEYSFADLIKAENQRNGTSYDPFGDLDEQRAVAAIAQRFEAKYGTKTLKSGRKRQTQDMDDYCDFGDGYDEDDPFIDNTEAYDEVVPSTLTTKYGGFYINQGKLDFKSISDDSNDTFVVEKPVKKHKRKIIESDSEEETPEAIAKKFKAMKRKKLLEGREAEKKKKKLGSSVNGDVIKKRKKKNLLKIKQSSRDGLYTSTPKTLPSVCSIASTAVTTATTTTASTPVTISTTAATPSAERSVNGISTIEEKGGVPEDIVMKDSANPINVEDSSSKSGDEDKKMESTSEEKNTQLPSSLPLKLAEDIEKIKELAKTNTEGKTKFFSGSMNKSLLISIENESLKLPKSHRSAIFHHLGEHLPSGKKALLRRTKKLRQSIDPMKESMDKLREAIELVMPKLIENHKMAVAKAKLEAKPNGTDTPTEDAATESDEEEGGKVDTKKPRKPRRKFVWTPEITELFLKVMEVKMGIPRVNNSKSQPPDDDYLKTFLESEVKPLWPNGWMNTRALLKIHRVETSTSVKSKKIVSGKASPVPVSDSFISGQQVSKMASVIEISSDVGEKKNLSKTDTIMEISSIMDDDVEDKKNVVINLPDSDTKPLPVLNMQSRTTLPSLGWPSLPTGMQASQVKSETKTISSKAGPRSDHLYSAEKVKSETKTISSKAGPRSDHLYNAEKVESHKSGNLSQPIVITESPAKSTPMKLGTVTSTPIPKAASTPVLTGSIVVSSVPLTNRSFLQALDPPSHQKDGPLPSKPQVSLSPQQQHKSNSVSNNVFQQQQQKKLSQVRNTLQQPNTGSNASQQKVLSQESKITLVQQKPAILGVTKDLHPVVSVTRIPTSGMAAPKQSIQLTVSKGGSSQAPNKLTFVNQRQSQNNLPFNSSSAQPQQNLSLNKKKQFQVLSPIQSQAVRLVSPPNPHNKKSSAVSSPVRILSSSGESVKQFSSKQSPSQPTNNSNSMNKQLLLNKSNPLPGSQIKSGIVVGTTLPKFKPQLERNTNSMTKPLSVQTSLMSSSAISASSIFSLSRTSTPSPQKSPASPGSTASSLYDSIQSHILNQESTEEQGLKVLAMAMKIEESGLPKLGQGHTSPSGHYK